MPLSVRRGVREPLKFVDGIPPHLKSALVEWVSGVLHTEGRYLRAELLSSLVVQLQWPITVMNSGERFSAAVLRMMQDDVAFLDALDLLLHKGASAAQHARLERMLDEGMSVYRVRLDPPGLEERTAEATRSLAVAATTPDDAASEHIKAAWVAAYGRDADPTAAWNSAIKGVEHLLHPIAQPDHATATLGTMAGALRVAPENWTFAIGARDGDTSARPFLRALELVTYEPGRHGTDPKRATLEQARVVVLQAITIVEWLRAGALVRNP